MKTIKIIDLLHMIANGNIPKRIIYDKFVYQWNNIIKNYAREVDRLTCLNWDYIAIECLNAEVEIIEEDNKIEKIERLEYSTNFNKEEFMLYKNILAVNGNVNDLIDRVYELEKRYEKQDK